jgi:hypothetical protein
MMGKKGKKKVKRRRWHAVADRVKAGAVGAEVGVYLGVMSKNLFLRIPRLTLYMVDRWAVYSDAEREGAPQTKIARIKDRMLWKKIKATALKVAAVNRRGAKVIIADSVEAAAKVKDHSLDFVFIDGDHRYEGVARDIAAWLPKVKPGGWLMGHDYGNKPDGGVKRAVDELGVKVELDCDHVWAVRL